METRTNRMLPEPTIDAAMVFIFLGSMWFPGNYTHLFGNWIQPVYEYTSFFIQIILMLLSSGQSPLEITLINLKSKFGGVYFFILVMFLDSMLVTWSPKEQLISCIRFTVTILFALWVSEHFEIQKLMQLICKAQAALILFILAAMVLMPEYAWTTQGGRSLCGIVNTKNTCASELLFGGTIFLIYFRMKKDQKQAISLRSIAFFALNLILLFLCNATGARIEMILMAIYVKFLFDNFEKKYRVPSAYFYFSINALFLFIVWTILPMFEPILKALGKSVTLTGRTILWHRIVEVMTRSHTFTGYGYSMFWRDPHAVVQMHNAFGRYSWYSRMTSGCHNDMFELWTNIGLFGIGALAVAMFWSFRRTENMTRNEYLVVSTCMLMQTIGGLTERTFMLFQYQTLTLFIMMGIGCSSAARRKAHGSSNPVVHHLSASVVSVKKQSH